VNLLSRSTDVNLGNMPVVAEETLSATTVKSMLSGNDAALVQWLSSLPFDTSDADDETWKLTRFETTPKMSTYLVAWATGPFEYLESSYTSPLSGKTKRLRIYGTSFLIRITEGL
jgi:aminopeptidase 2